VFRVTNNPDRSCQLFLKLTALEHLRASGEVEETQRRHAAYYLRLAEEGSAHLWTQQMQDWLSRLVCDQDNLRTALAWLQKSPDGVVASLRMAGPLWDPATIPSLEGHRT
jgi:predicted ATPase